MPSFITFVNIHRGMFTSPQHHSTSAQLQSKNRCQGNHAENEPLHCRHICLWSVWHKGEHANSFGPGIRIAACLTSKLQKPKSMLELQLLGQTPLVFSTECSGCQKFRRFVPPHHKAKTSINTGHKALLQAYLKLFLSFSPCCTLLYFGVVQLEESPHPIQQYLEYGREA